MCDGDKTCGKCKSRTAAVVSMNKATVKQFDGRKVVVVPVIMAKGDVVMNGGFLPADEYEPLSWTGIPVTVGHPSNGGEFASARNPDVHEEWVVGTLYNVQVVDNSLRAEAWIDIEKADRVHPGLVNELVKGAAMDVSTGYFCSAEAETGKINGREYHEVQRDIIPDHLALLPNEVGACNWKDGCGVRPNKEKFSMPMKVRHALKIISNALASENKKSTVTVDDIIANANSPYTEEDRESLTKMSTNTLAKIASSFKAHADDEDEVEDEDDEDEVVNEDGDEEDDEVKNAEGDEEEEEKKTMKKKKNSSPLSASDREALAVANRLAGDHRRSLVQKITGNSKMTEKDLKAFTLPQLESIANGLSSGSYAGRAHAEGEADDVADSMMNTGIVNALRAKKKENA